MGNRIDFTEFTDKELRTKLNYFITRAKEFPEGADSRDYYNRRATDVTNELKERVASVGTTYPPGGNYNPDYIGTFKLPKWVKVLMLIGLIIFVSWCSYYWGYSNGFDNGVEMFIK